jgi:hypothetical protein
MFLLKTFEQVEWESSNAMWNLSSCCYVTHHDKERFAFWFSTEA